MIRLASLGVLVLAGALALAAFFLARGTEGEVSEITSGTASGPRPAAEAPATPEVERLYFLRGIDFDQGAITLVLYPSGNPSDRLVIRDQDALRAARDRAYVNTTTTTGEVAGSLLLAMMGAPPEETIAQIFRDDVLVASVTCASTSCGPFSDSPDVDYAGLADVAVAHEVVTQEFSSYDSYLAAIESMTTDPNFMLLDQRPVVDFPLPRRPGHLIVELPTVITDDPGFNPALHEALVQTAIEPLVPEGATLDWVRVTNLGPGVVADADNMQPMLAGGAPVPVPGVSFYSVRVRITGTTTLPNDVYEALTAATVRQIDIDTVFADFVSSSLQTDCDDCLVLHVDGDIAREARAFDWRREAYYLSYYDLRPAP